MRFSSTDLAWLGLLVYVVGCNLVLDEMMSTAADRYLTKRRWLANAIMLAVYLHVSNRIPARVDPIHGMFLATRRVGVQLGWKRRIL